MIGDEEINDERRDGRDQQKNTDHPGGAVARVLDVAEHQNRERIAETPGVQRLGNAVVGHDHREDGEGRRDQRLFQIGQGDAGKPPQGRDPEHPRRPVGQPVLVLQNALQHQKRDRKRVEHRPENDPGKPENREVKPQQPREDPRPVRADQRLQPVGVRDRRDQHRKDEEGRKDPFALDIRPREGKRCPERESGRDQRRQKSRRDRIDDRGDEIARGDQRAESRGGDPQKHRQNGANDDRKKKEDQRNLDRQAGDIPAARHVDNPSA